MSSLSMKHAECLDVSLEDGRNVVAWQGSSMVRMSGLARWLTVFRTLRGSITMLSKVFGKL